jgi:predicted transposase/invertase (TIGR01784 family)
MAQRINPFVDEAFKRIFGQEPTKDLLIDFLNSLLEGERKITDVRFLDKEQVRENAESRTLIYDVYCETDTGERIIVEMQNNFSVNYKKRSIYYLSRAISTQGGPGINWQFDISAVYCISLLNFTMDAISKKFRTDVALMDMESKELFSWDERLIYLQLPYFTKPLEQCETNFEKWIYILNHMEVLEKLPKFLQSDVFKRLAEVTDVDSLSKEERREYDLALKHYRDTRSVLAYSELEGEKKGEKKGRKKEKREIAKKLRVKGYDLLDIADTTGLSVEEIEKL